MGRRRRGRRSPTSHAVRREAADAVVPRLGMWLMDGMPQDISVRVILAVLMATFLPPIDVARETYSNQTFKSFRDAAILYPDAELIGEATTHLSAVRSVINWTELPTGCLDSEKSFQNHISRLREKGKAARLYKRG